MYADECKAVPNGYKEIIESAKKLAKKLISENKTCLTANARTKPEIIKEVWGACGCDIFRLREAKDVVNEAYAELEALKVAKESLLKGENKLVTIKNIKDANGFSLKQAKDIVDEAQIELLHQTPDITHIDFSQVRRDMDLYAELVEKIEGLEAQIRLITNMYPYIVFPRYAREPSQPTTQEQKA